jgi:hypothetical protein
MSIVHGLLRYYAYAYHFLMAAFLVGLAAVAYVSGTHNLEPGGMVNYSGKELTDCLLGIGLTGIVVVFLALFNKLRWLFPIYALLAMLTLFRWFFVSSYRFSDRDAFWSALGLFAGAVGAFLGSLMELKRGRKRAHRR